MRQRILVTAVWLAGTVAAMSLALVAVNLVGDRVTDGSTAAAPPATAPTTAPTTAPGSTAPAPITTAAPPAVTTGTFSSAGGSVGVACEGDAARLLWASPNGGFAAEVHDEGPERIEVRFGSDEQETRVRVGCAGGAPVEDPEDD